MNRSSAPQGQGLQFQAEVLQHIFACPKLFTSKRHHQITDARHGRQAPLRHTRQHHSTTPLVPAAGQAPRKPLNHCKCGSMPFTCRTSGVYSSVNFVGASGDCANCSHAHALQSCHTSVDSEAVKQCTHALPAAVAATVLSWAITAANTSTDCS